MKEEKKSCCSSLCRDRVLCVTTKIQANRKEALSRKKIVCSDRKWEEYDNSAETKKVYVATRFFSRMSTPGRIFHDKEAPIATNETDRKQNSVTT